MRRLVVSRVLPGDRDPVLWVVHKRDETVLGRNRARVDAQFLFVARGPDHFLAPVAPEVAAHGWRGFGAVGGGASMGDEERVDLVGLPVPFDDAVAVEELVEEIAIPVDAE